MKRIINVIAAVVTLAIPVFASAASWSIDTDHSSVGFKVRHMMVSNVKGDFGKFNGVVEIDDKDVTKSKVDVVIDTTSINTGVAKRDDHLKSADFFDVAKYPTMAFVSSKVKKAGNDKLKVYGKLSLHGVTRDVVLDVEGPTKAYKDPWGNTKRGAVATTKISRKDFGLTYNAAIESGGVMVGDEVTIALEIELLKK
ncbi:YceI family protein [Geobacter argillaceus]|uniref:Polyisoprenoid-binding protein YceI n=1 Tax=Geobacter argillaceus TaxID=345631 RepID=A0A562VIF1_9BACT|nr:YceI family protein [Geobacter argillaceus]TWJ17564.1 polyisoprenoid-binding protein YceI [Geobacter argillaceus]